MCFSSDSQHTILQSDLDIIFINTRKISLDVVAVTVFLHIYGGHQITAIVALPEEVIEERIIKQATRQGASLSSH